MGICQKKSQKDNSQKQTGYESEQIIVLTSIQSHIQYFDQIDLELLKYPDISLLLRKHIKNYTFIEEGKTWVVVKEIQSFLNNKMPILIRNFNPETDAALQLIQVFESMVFQTQKVFECSVTFNEAKVELFQLFQNQLVQTSIECLIVVNTLISKRLQWWNEEYFKWRQNHLISMFIIKNINKSNKEIIGPIYDFIQLLIECIRHFGDIEVSKGVQETDLKAEQKFLDQFYNQMRIGLIQNSFFSESISNEVVPEQIQIDQNVRAYAILINKK
ncbi:unnamed protein product (macronuclear) [Paramecium tetraurelia]|uniref:Uncharacterized protein n=1 Tax=Paramecium tetraurelia TaxID=5888 RepID=A0DPA9_PARTE|nr:uncharacterized protein GSPATT00019058001 [Paramecium tetraurelia]CAK84876.1 unnamed protein product [Paramecium tetraurelia]|eukprot:XP_001452273.1 hypothetical protein (macronuclear) [Paramecium tetraurelia strain d4-2]